MNITKGCTIECALLCGNTQMVPVKVIVVNEEYLKGGKGNPFHLFEVKILEHLTEYRYNKYLPIGEIVDARGCDLYDGKIVEYPSDYERLCKEKGERKKLVNDI